MKFLSDGFSWFMIFLTLVALAVVYAQNNGGEKQPQGDTTLVWMKKEAVVKMLEQDRSNLQKEYMEYFVKDAAIQGQINMINAIQQDSIKFRKR